MKQRIITFRVRRSRGEMYICHGSLCVCVSVPHRHRSILALLHGRRCSLVVHYWADLQSTQVSLLREMSASACTRFVPGSWLLFVPRGSYPLLASMQCWHFGQARQWLELFQLILDHISLPIVWVCQSVVPIPPETLKFLLVEKPPWLGTPVL